MPVNGCCCACISGTTCPAGLATTYAVSVPAALNTGSCTGFTGCSPSDSSVTVGGSSCLWTHTNYVGGLTSNPPSPICIGGTATSYYAGAYFDVVMSINATAWDGTSCSVYRVMFTVNKSFSDGTALHIIYEKKRLSSSDGPVGTYQLVAVTDASFTPCTGATADDTITVSP